MAENFITQIQVSDSTYNLNATYLKGKAFEDYTIDGQSIYNNGSGNISILTKYNVLSSSSLPSSLEPNTKYIFSSNVSSLDFTNINWNNAGYNYCEYIFIFNSGVNTLEEGLNFIFPEDWYWSNGEDPFIEPNMRYELSVSVINTGNNNIVHAILVPFVKVNNE